jgi:transcriptional regulator
MKEGERMYIPSAFEQKDVSSMHGFIRLHPFATVVTAGSDGLAATHLPLLLHSAGSQNGVLRGHMARPNMHWRESDGRGDSLAIFSGVDHYISPTWYPSKQQDGRVVPTWNYAVVHAHGPLTVHEDPVWLLDHLNNLVTAHESGFDIPWRIKDAPREYIERQLKGIVGVEIAIVRLEGKWKLSQNRREEDRVGVKEGLCRKDTAQSLALKAEMDGL